MIEELTIRDLGVIKEARLPLGPGFTVLTGETGAGKTMVVTALGLLLGQRADSQVLRKGSGSAVVEGNWLIPAEGSVADRVRDAGGELDSAGEGLAALVLSRSVSAEGRSRAVVGGRTAPVGVLGELGEELVVVHGQSDQIRLRSASAQRDAVDRFGGEAVSRALSEYQRTYQSWQALRDELTRLIAEQDRRAEEAQELRVAIEEIERVAPQRGEDSALAERAERLGNLEELRLAAQNAHEALSSQDASDGDALALLDAAKRALERVAEHDSALAPIADSIASASFAVADAAAQLSGYLGSLDAEGANELDAIQSRRAELFALARKHDNGLDGAIDLLDSGSARLLELDNDSERIHELTAEVEARFALLGELAERLSQLRTSAAAQLSSRVTAELGALAMADAQVLARVDSKAEFSLTGKDEVSLLLQPHQGAEPRPLGRGASGGELSRVMLAIEVVVAASDPVPTFIFDEVDAGVGGASAIEIGKRLARLAESSQVVVVTHLAQVAAFATNHLRVVKDSDGGVTASSVQQLSTEERAEELARMLSGLSDSDSGLAHARELLETAQSLA